MSIPLKRTFNKLNLCEKWKLKLSCILQLVFIESKFIRAKANKRLTLIMLIFVTYIASGQKTYFYNKNEAAYYQIVIVFFF